MLSLHHRFMPIRMHINKIVSVQLNLNNAYFFEKGYYNGFLKTTPSSWFFKSKSLSTVFVERQNRTFLTKLFIGESNL